MIETLQSIDHNLMLTLNMAGGHSVFLDAIFHAISMVAVWIPVYLCLLYTIIKSKKKESLLIVLSFVVMIVLADQITSGILKPLVARLRPSHDPSIMDQLQYVYGYKGGTYGFPSSHASNTFGMATMIVLLFKNRLTSTCFLLWAFITAYSRIYLGVHFPSDVLCGAVIGCLCGYFSYLLYKKARSWEKLSKWINNEDITKADTRILTCSLILTFVFIVIIGFTK